MSNIQLETDLAEILKEIQLDQKKVLEQVNDLKLGQAKLEGKMCAIEEKLSRQIKGASGRDDSWSGV